MLANKTERGFSKQVLETMNDPRIRKDENGYYIMSLSENCKVYFEDFYQFLEMTYNRSSLERERITAKIATLSEKHPEMLAFFRARGVIVDMLMRTITRFYTDGTSFGIIMTPWCFGTVVLEKIEIYRDRINRGDVNEAIIPDYPYYVTKYIDEIHQTTLLEMFDFPEKAFQMRWQYAELLKKYSKILAGVTSSLQSVLSMIRSHKS